MKKIESITNTNISLSSFTPFLSTPSTGDKKFLSPFNLYYDTYPEFVRVPFGDTAAILNQIDGDTAGVLLETVPATLGMPIPPK